MKKHTLIALTLSLLAITQTQAQDNPLFNHIPPDAGSVTHINVGSIATKIGWDDLIHNIPLQQLKLGQFEKVLSDPASAGFDLHGQVLIAMTGDSPDSVTYTTIIFPILDSAKFRAFVHQVFPDDRIRRNPDKSFSIFHKNATTSWNDKLVVRVEAKPSAKAAMSKVPAPVTSPVTHARSLAALKGFAGSFYTTDPIFKEEFGDDADIHFCYEHGGALSKLSKKIPSKELKGLNLDAFDMSQKKYTEIRFDNGKLTVNARVILKPDMAAMMKRQNTPPFNPDIIARLPKGELLGFANIRFDKVMAGQLLGKMGLKNMADSMLRKLGIDPSDLAAALKTDITFAIVGGDAKTANGKPKPDIYFIAPVDDMTALHHLGQELMTIAAKDSANADTSSKHKKNMTAEIVHHSAVQDGLLVISGSKEQSEAYFKSEKRNTDMVPAELRASPTILWVDLHAVVNYIANGASGDANPEKTRAILEKLGVLDKIIVSGNVMHEGELRTTLELTTTRKDENILKTIVSMVH